MTLAEKITKWLSQPGMSARRAAKLVGVSGQTIGRWADGSREPRASELGRLAAAMGCTADDLVNESRSAQPPPPPSRESVALSQVVEILGEKEALARLVDGAAGKHVESRIEDIDALVRKLRSDHVDKRA